MHEIEIEESGKRYTAEYVVSEGMITIYGDSGEISASLNAIKDEEKFARQLLHSLVKQDKIKLE